MLNLHALEVNMTTHTISLDGRQITVIGETQPHLDADAGLLTVTVTLPLSSITVKTPGGSARVDAPEVGK